MVVCRSILNREIAEAMANHWTKTNPFGTKYKLIPAACVRKLFPDVIWTAAKVLEWPP